MGGGGGQGGKKVFTRVEGGSKSFGGLQRGVKKFDDKNFQLPSPPHQSIYEHSLSSGGSKVLKSGEPILGNL